MIPPLPYKRSIYSKKGEIKKKEHSMRHAYLALLPRRPAVSLVLHRGIPLSSPVTLESCDLAESYRIS